MKKFLNKYYEKKVYKCLDKMNSNIGNNNFFKWEKKFDRYFKKWVNL